MWPPPKPSRMQSQSEAQRNLQHPPRLSPPPTFRGSNSCRFVRFEQWNCHKESAWQVDLLLRRRVQEKARLDAFLLVSLWLLYVRHRAWRSIAIQGHERTTIRVAPRAVLSPSRSSPLECVPCLTSSTLARDPECKCALHRVSLP